MKGPVRRPSKYAPAAAGEKEVSYETSVFPRRRSLGDAASVRRPLRVRLPDAGICGGPAAGPHVSPHGPGRAGLQ